MAPTHDYVIDNQTAPNFRADLNSALQAIVSNNSSTTEPPVTYANMIWYDTANNLLRMRNEADDAFITLGTLNQVANTFAAAVALASQAEAEAGTENTKLMTPLRVKQSVVANATSTVPTTAQVLSATAGASAGIVGTYAFLGVSNSSHTSTYGETRAGSQLFPAGITAQAGLNFNGLRDASFHAGQSNARAGTWRCMGVVRSVAGGPQEQSHFGASLWLRIS